MGRPLVALWLLVCAGCGSPVTTGNDAEAPLDLAVPDLKPVVDLSTARFDLVVVGPCDTVTQNCSAPDSKCTLGDTAVGLGPTCLPATGTGAFDDPCVRGDGGIGNDTCAAGSFCSSIGSINAELSARHCRQLCHDDGDCRSPGARCLSVTATEGVCAETCALLGSDCPTDYECVWLLSDLDGVNVYGTCGTIGKTAAGMRCGGTTDCVSGTVCMDPSQSGQSSCVPLCDDAHPCAKGTCVPIPPAPRHGGFCRE